jgi:hypothetical protein
MVNGMMAVTLLFLDASWYVNLACAAVGAPLVGLVAMFQVNILGRHDKETEPVVLFAALSDPRRLRGRILFPLALTAIVMVEVGIIADLGWLYFVLVGVVVPVVAYTFAFLVCRRYQDELAQQDLSW